MVGLRPALGAAFFAFIIQHPLADARPITLTEAFDAAERSPALGAAAAFVDEARGNVEQAGAYTYNPSIGVSGGPSFGPGGTLYEIDIGINQPIELGGKRGARRRAATAERDAASETLTATRAELLAEVRRAFEIALVAGERVKVTRANEVTARELRAAATERLSLGAATQTEVNVAAAGLGRAVASTKAAEREVLLARQALGDVLGIVGADLEPSGSLPTFPSVARTEDQLVGAALAARRDLAAAERVRIARGAQVDLADSLAVPDPELSVSWVRSAVEDTNAVIVGLRVEIPLWNRNQGNRRSARAAQRRVTIETEAMRRDVEREVRTGARRYRAATEAVAAFDQQVVGTLAENLELARETMAAGKLGLLELNAVRRDLVESQLTYLDAVAEAVESRAALEVALGRSLESKP
ncbi:MAG: TolC family protein [Kofleriaceae bacterium]